MEWIAVTDRLPEPRAVVVIARVRRTIDGSHERDYEIGGYSAVSGRWWWFTGGDGKHECSVTHWMPLPDLPA